MVSSPGVTLFTAEHPIVIRMADLYVPGGSPLGTTFTGNIIPTVDTLVIDSAENIWVVSAVDSTTHLSTLVPARMSVDNTNPDDSLTSIISYGNDIFQLYYDPRTSPLVVWPESRLIVRGLDNETYQIVINPGNAQTVISASYDQNGNFLGPTAPLAPVVGADGTPWIAGKYLTPCYANRTLTDGQEVFFQVFNAQGAQTATISAFAKASVIINEVNTPIPVITGIAIAATQSRSNNELYIFEKQDVDSLGITITLTYADGHTRTAAIDGAQTFIYGLEDFIPSYPGLQQTILVKYFLANGETANSGLLATNPSYITAEAALVVVSNELQSGVKISTIPVWNASTGKFSLNFFLYTTTRGSPINVTSLVSITGATFSGNAWGVQQNLTLKLNLMQALPSVYSVATIYQQTCLITLQPVAALVRYIIADASNATVVYGADSTNNRRPVVHFDVTRSQYYIPSPIFTNQAAFLQSFYTDASPPYDTGSETAPPVPTHFQLRDPVSGAMLVAAPIALASYAASFSIIGAGLANRYANLGSSVIVEFVTQINSSTWLIDFGASVDTYVAVYNN